MKLKQLLVLTLAVVFFTACGSKKEAAQQPAAPQTTDTANPGPTISSDEAKKKAEADKKAQDEANSKRPPRNKQTGNKKSTPPKGSAGNQSTLDESLSFTGGAAKSGMLFTGAAEDGLIGDLLEEEKMKLAVVQDRNAILAASIWDMAYMIDNQGDLHLDIEVKNGNGMSKVQAKTRFTRNQEMRISSNEGTASDIQLTALCLDKDPKAAMCANLLVTLAKGNAQATAILRQSYANIRFEYERVELANEYSTLVQFFKNASLDVETPNKIKTAHLHTYEVVKGKSGFKVVITGKRNQLIGFSADLVVKKNSLDPNVTVEKETQFKDIDLFMGRIPSKDLAFSRSISDARLIYNSTKGQITIDMLVSSASSATKNSFTLTFTRIPVPAYL